MASDLIQVFIGAHFEIFVLSDILQFISSYFCYGIREAGVCSSVYFYLFCIILAVVINNTLSFSPFSFFFTICSWLSATLLLV